MNVRIEKSEMKPRVLFQQLKGWTIHLSEKWKRLSKIGLQGKGDEKFSFTHVDLEIPIFTSQWDICQVGNCTYEFEVQKTHLGKTYKFG